MSDTTLETDRTLKCEIYAEAGIPEYWIVNLVDSCLEIYRELSRSGTYAWTQRLDNQFSLAPLSFPDCQFSVMELL